MGRVYAKASQGILLAAILLTAVFTLWAQSPGQQVTNSVNQGPQSQMRSTTSAQRRAAAKRLNAQRMVGRSNKSIPANVNVVHRSTGTKSPIGATTNNAHVGGGAQQ